MEFLSAVVAWSLKNRAFVLVVTALLAVFGVRAALELPVDAIPDITNVQVQIMTAAPALSPVEVEQYVSIPVERAMAGLPNSTQVRSISKYGLSVVTVVFKDETNIYFARQLVNERIREAQNAVPSEYGTPELGPISSGLGEILQFVVQNDGLSLMQRQELLEWQIAPQLRTVPGVVEVNGFGGEERQYQVVLEPKRLQAAGVSVAQVIEALEKSNRNAGGGYIERDREQFVIGTNGLVKNLDDLRRVVIGATPAGVPITVSTVGDVRFGPRLRRGAATRNGQGEAVVGIAMMLLGENSRTVTEAVKQKLAKLGPSLPAGTTIEPFYDRSVLVNRTIHTVGKNLLEGALLVIAVLLLLLGNLRAGLVVALVIPLSMLMALIVMHALGLSGNLMSLGAVDFGLLVDGAVIVVENAVRRLGEQRRVLGRELTALERLSTVQNATLEVRRASVFGEAIIAIVYLPILALTGVEGKLFRPMATTVLFALASAFVLSLTLVPVLSSYVITPKPHDSQTWLLRRAQAAYARILPIAMNRRIVTLSIAVLALASGAALLTRLGAEFVPRLDEGDMVMEARRLPGIGLDESIATALRLERALRSIPEITHAVNRIGAPQVATDPMGIEQSDVYLGVKPRAEWRPGLTRETLTEELAAAAEKAVPEVGGSFSQPIEQRVNEMVAGVRSDVAVFVYGTDMDELRRRGEQIAALARKVPGAVDVRVEQATGLKYLRIAPERAKLARYGLTIEDVNQITETIAVGYGAGHVLENERRFEIAVKTQHGFAGDLEPLRMLPLRSLNGQIVPLGDVATLALIDGPAQVNRESQSRRLIVEFNVRGRDLLSVVEDAQTAVSKAVTLPVGYRIEWGGQFEHYTEARARLAFVVPLALGLIVFLLWLAFESARSALLIFANVPFAVVGGVFALWLRDIPFSISAGVGFIALFGVAVLNGLVLVSFALELEATGLDHWQAIRSAAETRLRPVLTTAVVAALGFMPMAVSTAPGSEVQRPLATVVIGGLLSATVLTLFILPLVYGLAGGSRAKPQSAP